MEMVRLAMFIIDALWFSACDYLKNDRKKYYEALNQANGGNYQNFIDVSKLLVLACIYINALQETIQVHT
jgi:hypothetical protein